MQAIEIGERGALRWCREVGLRDTRFGSTGNLDRASSALAFAAIGETRRTLGEGRRAQS